MSRYVMYCLTLEHCDLNNYYVVDFFRVAACKNQPTCITDTVWYMIYIYIWVGSFWLKRASFSHMAFKASRCSAFSECPRTGYTVGPNVIMSPWKVCQGCVFQADFQRDYLEVRFSFRSGLTVWVICTSAENSNVSYSCICCTLDYLSVSCLFRPDQSKGRH